MSYVSYQFIFISKKNTNTLTYANSMLESSCTDLPYMIAKFSENFQNVLNSDVINGKLYKLAIK